MYVCVGRPLNIQTESGPFPSDISILKNLWGSVTGEYEATENNEERSNKEDISALCSV